MMERFVRYDDSYNYKFVPMVYGMYNLATNSKYSVLLNYRDTKDFRCRRELPSTENDIARLNLE